MQLLLHRKMCVFCHLIIIQSSIQEQDACLPLLNRPFESLQDTDLPEAPHGQSDPYGEIDDGLPAIPQRT